MHIYKILLFKLWLHFERQEMCFDQPKFNPQKPTMFNYKPTMFKRVKTYYV
jgi:hypothetical protein